MRPTLSSHAASVARLVAWYTFAAQACGLDHTCAPFHKGDVFVSACARCAWAARKRAYTVHTAVCADQLGATPWLWLWLWLWHA